MTSTKRFTFDFIKIAETSHFLSFALIISSVESQSKAQSNMESLGENRTGSRVENIDFFHR